MFARIGAGLKGAFGAPLGVADLATIMGPTLTDPEKLLGQLFDSVVESWKQVDGVGAFTDHWRTTRFLPYLAAIAAQPTNALQQCKLVSLILDEEEGMTWAAQTSKLPDAQFTMLLAAYPAPDQAHRDMAWKRERVGLDLGIHLLNMMALMLLAQKAYGRDADLLQSWVDLYADAYKHKYRLQVVISTMAAIVPDLAAPQLQQLTVAGRPYLEKLQSLLATQHDDIANGRQSQERFRDAYNRMADIKAAYLRDVLGGDPGPNEHI